MAYDYDVDILAALWTGAEDAEEPYASIIAANPDLFDEVAENRILSSIELLRSHMELLASRDEANVLHFAISRLIRHTAGGSNPWSEAAAVTEAVGNVNNPTFPAGATLDIDIDGVVVSPVSATGGDCQTVVSELNVALDAAVPGAMERTNVDVTGESVDSLSGTYFTINSANDATAYYAWFDHASQPERTDVVTIGDTGGSLGGKYFTINSTGDAANYYAWLIHPGRHDVTNGGPNVGTTVTALGAGMYDFDIIIDGGGTQVLTITTVGGETYSALAALMSAVVAGGTVTYVDAPDFAFRFESSSTTSPSSATILPGSAGSPGGNFFTALDAADGTTHFSIVAVTAVDPAPGGLTGIEIPYLIDDGGLTMASKVAAALGGHPDFTAFDAGGTAFITTATAGGGTTDSADVDTGFTVSTGQQGLDAAVDPAPGGLTGIPIFMSAGSSDGEIGSSVRADVGANADFSTEGVGADADIENVAAGATTDATAGTSGLPVTVTTQGSDAAGDAVPVTAICVQPGNRIGIRGQEDQLTFSLSNGGGGIIGPGGIIPGERASTVKRVADEGRDAATGNVVGTLRRLGGL